ncbi:hypothetical protein HYX58_02970 [Candidatus Dependentiae bacterium]|nr:hypothetical protein [Candidatus Dependentiae bacterium]
MKKIIFTALIIGQSIAGYDHEKEYKNAIESLKGTPPVSYRVKYKKQAEVLNTDVSRRIVHEYSIPVQHKKLFYKLEQSAHGYFFGVHEFKKNLNAMDFLTKKEAQHIDAIASSYNVSRFGYQIEQLCWGQFFLGMAAYMAAPFMTISYFKMIDTTPGKIMFAVSSIPITAIGAIEILKQLDDKNEERQDLIRGALRKKIPTYDKD